MLYVLLPNKPPQNVAMEVAAICWLTVLWVSRLGGLRSAAVTQAACPGHAAPASSLGGPGEVCWEAASPLKGQAWESYDITPTASTSGTSPKASPGDRARACSMSGWEGWQHCFAKGVREYGEGSGGRQWHSVFPFVEFCFCISHDVPTFLCMGFVCFF